jgi:hypothetical protein
MSEIAYHNRMALRRRRQKMKFTEVEDEIIRNAVQTSGPHQWKKFADLLPNRTGRQIRERWKNYLAPNLTTAQWTEEEDAQIAGFVATYGRQWAKIAENMPNRTDVCIKNRFALLTRRRRRAATLGPKRTRHAKCIAFESCVTGNKKPLWDGECELKQQAEEMDCSEDGWEVDLEQDDCEIEESDGSGI